ncbi:MarP family serine protease [Nesterenkonia cremea]|uniref:Serine protease n=1 Tax=Nesterenkonia cremea TaxID=1882340 RepID=A0A917ESS7_9MICC|nr:MarP family serine protease [Nesterenkonia cremea]GGE75375.1 serine protease [Nesterenkonia cremea]
MGITLLDVILVLVLIGFLAVGLRKGLWITVGGAAGFLVGAVAAFFAMPLVAEWVSDPVWRVVAVLAAAIVLVVAGHALGTTAGAEIQRLFRSPTLHTLGSLVGGLANLVVAVFVIAALSFSVSAMGFPTVNQHMKQSAVLQGINSLVPERTEAWFAQLRTAVMESDIPELAQPLVPESAELPDDVDLTEAAEHTAGAVGRISGVAEHCGQSQTGTGFAITPTRVVTNAHVIAGVSEPSVEMATGEVVTGRTVYFNPANDLAVLAVDPLDVPEVEIGEPADSGASGFVMGYPAGGPFVAGPAIVQARDVSQVNDIYGGSPSEVEIYQLNADVRQGNSGGPLVDEEGRLLGVVFARAVEGSAVGFALTAEEAGEVLTNPEGFTETVSTGRCVDR